MDEKSTPSEITQDPFAAVRIPEYRNLMLGRFTFIMALRMMGTLVGWWVYQLTNDPFAIGLIGLSEVVPALSMALYSGHIIDISVKKKLLMKSMFFYICAASALLLISTPLVNGRIKNDSVAYIIYGVI